MSSTSLLRIAKRYGLAPSPTALFVLLITCCPALAIAAKQNMTGEYVGQVENAGKLDKVVTSLRWSGKETLSGTYVITGQDGETKGRLKDCKRLHSQLLKCVWIDKYGYGHLELNFDDRFTAFHGEWSYFGGVEQYVWNGAKRLVTAI